MNDIFLDLGFMTIKWYSFLMFVALLLGIFLVLREAKRFKINESFMVNLIFWTAILGFIGARLYFVLFNFDYYSSHLNEIYKIWEGGLAIHGAIILGGLFIILYTKKYKVKTLRIFDILAPALLLGQAIGSWGNFFNGEAHGGITTLSFLQSLHLPDFIIEGMHINGVYYHPTFLYESLWSLIGVIILLILRRTRYIKVGNITAIYLMWYSFGRFFIEGLRTDSLMLGNFRIAQIISIILFITGLIILIISKKKSKLENLYNSLDKSENVDVKF